MKSWLRFSNWNLRFALVTIVLDEQAEIFDHVASLIDLRGPKSGDLLRSPVISKACPK